MNLLSSGDLTNVVWHRIRRYARHLDRQRQAATFTSEAQRNAISVIYVINLDRKPDRWNRMRGELDRFEDRTGTSLLAMTRRASAVDARYVTGQPDDKLLVPRFSLADQLTVAPNDRLAVDERARGQNIDMTRQETAVALSHIAVWEQIANGVAENALVLEDDVFMRYGFAHAMASAWAELQSWTDDILGYELLYLSFDQVRTEARHRLSPNLFRASPGLWQASGYVLTKRGARALLDLLPMHGPVDLWLNLQFRKLRVFTAATSIIEQRIDEPSTNSYSVLPILSQVGVVTKERPLLPQMHRLPHPVFAFGAHGTGLTSLATALSMLGYTCCHDLTGFPGTEWEKLVDGRTDRLFNAYVNVGELDAEALELIRRSFPEARFIATGSKIDSLHTSDEARWLHLDSLVADKWASLAKFLDTEYPPFPYPAMIELGRRDQIDDVCPSPQSGMEVQKRDRSPWICAGDGIHLPDSGLDLTQIVSVDWHQGQTIDHRRWFLREDTFPSNLSVFAAHNFVERSDARHAALTFTRQKSSVRDFSSAAIASRESYSYGRFSACIKPAASSGLITGVFLHRNAPRQEIDIEFLGKDTKRMLVNVFYNPGPAGTKLEYGYRGTPALIDLGFDAASDFHEYEIEWMPHGICWRVDGAVVHRRALWEPTPIPDQPLEFNVNLWHSRSREFAGRLRLPPAGDLTSLRSLTIRAAQIDAQ